MPFLGGSAWSGRFDYLLLELTLLSEPPPAAERRLGRRTGSKAFSLSADAKPDVPTVRVRRSSPSKAFARVAREANRDQDQAFEILDFRARRTGGTGRRERIGKDFRHKRALRGRIGGAARICVLYVFLSNASAWSPPPNPVVRRADGRVRERFGEFCDR
jgi:hypothetical protein